MPASRLIFRQLFDPVSSTYTYLLGDSASAEALIIDSVFENERRDVALLRELDLHLVATLDTHVHADHVTGAWLLKQSCGSQILLSENSAAENVDRFLKDGERVAFGGRHLEVRATPGHTGGCLTFVLDDQSMAFTGDCLLIRGAADAPTFSRAARTCFTNRCSSKFSRCRRLACSTRGMTTAGSPSPAWRRSGASIRAWAARSTSRTSPAI